MPVLALRSELALHTRCENQIANEINRGGSLAGDFLQAADIRAKYRFEFHRPTSPSRVYNCHGLSFGSRRTWIHDPKEIAKILADDDYEIVPFDQVMPGDIAVYYVNGDAEHSGVVIKVEPLQPPMILSKWGFLHEVVHKVANCPYDARQVRYYRISK